MLGEMVPSSFNLYWRIVNKKSFNKGDFQEWEWGLGRTREGKSARVTTWAETQMFGDSRCIKKTKQPWEGETDGETVPTSWKCHGLWSQADVSLNPSSATYLLNLIYSVTEPPWVLAKGWLIGLRHTTYVFQDIPTWEENVFTKLSKIIFLYSFPPCFVWYYRPVQSYPQLFLNSFLLLHPPPNKSNMRAGSFQLLGDVCHGLLFSLAVVELSASVWAAVSMSLWTLKDLQLF